MLSTESSSVCQFIMMPDTQPRSKSFNKHVNISSLTRSSRSTCHNMRIKLWLIPPFLHLSSSVVSMLKPFRAGNRWSHVLHQIKKPGRQFRPFSVSTAASVCVSCSLCCFQGTKKTGAGNRQWLFSGNLSLRNQGQRRRPADLPCA